MSFRVTDKAGRVVKEGDTIESFRGDQWQFRSVTRSKEPGRSAKVYVEATVCDPTDGKQGQVYREFYAEVFGLTVEEVKE